MKYFSIIILLCFPCFLFGQNFKLRVGGSVSVSNAYLEDISNPLNNITLAELINGNYDNLFIYNDVNSIFSQKRSSEPNIGGNIHIIGLLNLSNSLSLRVGTDFQLVRFDRVVDRKVAAFDNFDNYKTTTEIFEIQYEIPLTAFYISLPIDIQYDFKKQGLSVYGGILFTARIADKNVDTRNGVLSIGYDKRAFVNPIMEEFFVSANLGLSYQIKDRINLDIQAIRGFTNMFDVFFRVPQQSFLQQLSVGVSYQLL